VVAARFILVVFAAAIFRLMLRLITILNRCHRFAEPVGQILGETAMNIVIRPPSFLLLCIGVQIVRNGVSAPLRTVMVVK
jgi:small neutral amino acid transporter SnatA (MarC family)